MPPSSSRTFSPVRDARKFAQRPWTTAADQGRGPNKAIALQRHPAQRWRARFKQRHHARYASTTPISCEDNRFYEVEHFQVLLLNTRKRLIRTEQISQGTLDTIWFIREKFETTRQRFGGRPGP